MQVFRQDRTARHVALVLALKLCLLAGLWWAFVREHRVEPDPGQVAAAVLRQQVDPAPRSPEPIP
ncbi:MAG: hypothetical protein MUC71_10085 [Steroidobacteraceae bacterium]|jgi:cbb3-type cytochrome oxidase subunit 3|nr:hypothetical protein [Steroidobacteraceae bacterium]